MYLDFTAFKTRFAILGKTCRFALDLIPRNTVVFVLQGKLRGKRWVIGSFSHLAWLGTYENEIQSELAKFIAPGDTVFDIGANAGYHTLLSSILVGPTGAVYSFEPLPRNLCFLKRHIKLNQLQNVTVIEAAVSNHTGQVCFTDIGAYGAMSHISENGKVRVRVISIDALVAAGVLPAPQCVKIDVEGGELSVITGMKDVILNSRPKIILETHRYFDIDIHTKCCDLLLSYGYSLATLDGQQSEDTQHLSAVPP